MTTRRAPTCSFGLLALLTLVAIAAPGCGGCSKPPPVALEVPEQTGALVFPPPDDGWLERAPLDDAGRSVRNEITLSSPTLDAKGRFEVSGSTFSLSFSDELFAERDLARAPALTLTPAHPGKTVWSSPRTLEFTADKPFDPDTDYTASLPELTGPSGNKLVGGFKGTFRATPETNIAGKIVHWVPKAGQARVVYVRPTDERDIGPAHTLLVIYDQPVDLGAVSKLVTLKTDKGAPVAVTAAHPPAGDSFEGEKVDTRQIVLLKMAPAPPPGTKLELAVRGQKADDSPVERKLGIGQLPKLDSVSCGGGGYGYGYGGSGSEATCEVKGTTIKGPPSSTVEIKYSNRVVNDDLDKRVTVTPKPDKLRLNGWGESIYVDAAWTPGTTYQIRVASVVDRFGYPAPAAAATFTALPRTASAILREGVLVMDEAGAKDFFVTTRNVKKGELVVWPVAEGGDALAAALSSARTNDPPSGAPSPTVLPFDGTGAPHVYERAPLDLWSKLTPGRAYLAQVRVKEAAHGASIASTDPNSGTKPSVPLIMLASKDTPGLHVHTVGQRALVHAFRFGSGEPIAGAQVAMGQTRSTTDDKGTAILDLPAKANAGADQSAVTVRAGKDEAVLPLDRAVTSASEIYPELTSSGGDWDSDRELLGVVITDRGIYRPGSTIHTKAHLRKADDKRIAAVPQAKVRLRVTDPLASDVVDEVMTTSAAGTITKDVEITKTGRTGRYVIKLELDDQRHTVIAEESVRVADFETPRFKVDLETPPESGMPPGRWKSRVVGRYFFGAAMDRGRVEWTLRKKRKEVDGGKFDALGFSFAREEHPFDSRAQKGEDRPRTGEGKLGPDGTLDVDVEIGPLANGPTEVTFEADVHDESYRHVAAKKSQLRHPAARYAGVRLDRRFGGVGPVKAELVVVDTQGKPVRGVPVEARLERMQWKKSAEKAESGAVVESWGYTTTTEGTCQVTSDDGPKGCDLAVKTSGEYQVVARVDGRDDATMGLYAWRSYGDEGPAGADAVPSSGKKIPISIDKKKYEPGETAKVLAQSPFAEATAILTMERGGLLSHEVRRVKGPSVVFDVPLALSHAPHAHAVVTLLPIGSPEAAYRVGVVKIPVSLDKARLTVKVTSDKKTYDTKESAEITVEVKRGDEPVKNADVTLAVVDEAVLRLTDFHAKDPTGPLHPARALSFSAADSRALLFRRREKAHVAGGGGADERDSIDTRKDFVETAAWLPALSTDGRGRATAKITLPDNLTEFRMMATVVGEDGSAGVAENGLVVTRPFLLEPILPAFALRGDKLEIGAMVHNNTDAAASVAVKIDGVSNELRVDAHGRARAAIPWTADRSREAVFELAVGGKTKDRVIKAVRVGLPGTEEHPQLSGVFRDKQEITLAVPEDAIFDGDAKLVVRTGAALYPELGQRLLYLMDYPHGCVEQTTSGLLPLLAAQNLIPWTGVVGLEEGERKKRIVAGVKRLGSMRAPNGGLAYWPGGSDSHLYGTVYAARALVRAKALGVEEEGLLPGVLKFLGERVRHEHDANLKVAIAEVLAEGKALEPDTADALFDAKADLDAYGLANLALALAELPRQEDRVKGILDELEASFDADGMPKREHGKRDWHYWGSADRDRAATLLALTKHRKDSKLATKLAHRLIRSVEGYTTQSTAWSLTALAAFVGEGRPNGGVDVKLRAPGIIFDRIRSLGGDNKEVGVPLSELRGKKILLTLEGDPNSPSAFVMEARWVRPAATSSRTARRAKFGPSVYRAYTDPKGAPIDLAKVKAGDVVRVALRIELPKLDDWRATHLAVTDRLCAGFTPVQPDLATVAQVPELDRQHPFYSGLTGWGGRADYVDVRDDRVNVYFDHVYGGRAAYATYLVRAVTPGEFLLPAARGELMYEPGSEGYSDSGRVVIK